MSKQEEIMEAKKQERERIIALINLWRNRLNLGASIQAGRLIRLAIRGEPAASPLDEEFMELLTKDRYQGVDIYGNGGDNGEDKGKDLSAGTRSAKRDHTKGHYGARMGIGRPSLALRRRS